MQLTQSIRPAADADDSWRAVVTRDRTLDGAFVYGVRTTGIYCRPSCSSRRPRRENVSFFSRPEEAERSGFRACLRCRPREERAAPPSEEAVRRACAWLDAHLEEPVTLQVLARAVGLSPHHLQRTFKRLVGVSPREYADARRMDGLRAGLQKGQTVTRAAYSAGFGSSRRIYQDAPLGMTPASYRRRGAGMTIGYAIVPSPLGRLLVAATERGICAVKLGTADTALERALREEYSAATLRRDDVPLGGWVREILRYLDGAQPGLNLPVDVQATAFQRQVWEALRAIPPGSTRSYQEVARAVGRPRAARAVARACATNPVALVIPCHRVVRSDGAPGGYRWGIERKTALLERERVAPGKSK